MKIVCCYWRSTFVEKHWDTVWSLASVLRPGGWSLPGRPGEERQAGESRCEGAHGREGCARRVGGGGRHAPAEGASPSTVVSLKDFM